MIREVPVYDRAREHILGYVHRQATSVGAAKKVGAKACAYALIKGEWAFHVVRCGDKCCRRLPGETSDA